MRSWKNPSSLTEAEPASSKTDMWLAKGKPKSISDSGIISKIIYLRWGKKVCNNNLEQACWQDLWLWGRLMLEKQAPDGLHPTEEGHAGAICSFRTALHGRDLVWSSLWRTGACWRDSCWNSLWGLHSAVPWEGLHPRAREESEESSMRRREQQSKLVMDQPQHPFSIPLHHSGTRRERLRSGV